LLPKIPSAVNNSKKYKNQMIETIGFIIIIEKEECSISRQCAFADEVCPGKNLKTYQNI